MECRLLSGPSCSHSSVGRWPDMGNNSMPHVITGERDQVAAVLNRARAEGRLVAVTAGRVLPDDRVRLVAHLREPSRPRLRWDQIRPWLVLAAKVAAVLALVAAVAGVVWLAVLAVMKVVALVVAVAVWIHAHALGICAFVITLFLVVGFLFSGDYGHGCVGVHCRGCRR